MSSLRPLRRLTSTDRPVFLGVLLLSGLYLWGFVARGWVPLDEGMIGQSAERVLRGATPHVDYEEPYTGALSLIYAAVFRLAGVDLVNLRGVMFLVALTTIALIYVIARRYLEPLGAAVAVAVSTTWSFPNYLSPLPSWWLLLCAVTCLWALIRYAETEELRFAALAGLAAGAAVTFKQTGIYLLPPLCMSLMIGSDSSPATGRIKRLAERGICTVVAAGGFAAVVLLTGRGAGSGEIVYLWLPIAASGIAFVLLTRGGLRINWTGAVVGVACASLPVAALAAPYALDGQLGDFLHGAFVLPQKRLQFTIRPMEPGTQIVAGIAALLWVFWAPVSLKPAELRIVVCFRWIVVVGLVAFSTMSFLGYTYVWEAARGAAALLPVLVAAFIVTRPQAPVENRIVFSAAAILVWMSLGQFPYAAPIYFCYVAPLAVIAGIATVRRGEKRGRLGDGPLVLLAVSFAVICMNRGYVWNVGAFYRVYDLQAPLGLPRASLRVAPHEADTYRRVVALLQDHAGPNGLVAGPDTPELYFLTGQFNRSGRLFEFFSTTQGSSEEFSYWQQADVVALFHGERFSPKLDDALVKRIREEFPKSEEVPPFEVRWR